MPSIVRFPIKADTKAFAYMLPSDRVKGSVPLEDVIEVLQRWYQRTRRSDENLEEAIKRLAAGGGLSHENMDAFASRQHDQSLAKVLPFVDWRKNFIPDPAMVSRNTNDVFSPKAFSEQVLFSTVRIQTFGRNTLTGAPSKGFATGFLFEKRKNKETERFLITNKHVLEGSQSATFSLHVAENNSEDSAPAGRTFDYHLENLELFISHPDSDVDLCALPFELIENAGWESGKDLYTRFLTAVLVPTAGTLELMPIIQEVYMYGYPIGLWDKFNYLPIVRRGSLASHPALDYCGKPQTAVDIAVFPGSSGSPVFVINDGGPISDKTGNVWQNRRVVVFLGVMTDGARMKSDGTVDTISLPVQQGCLGDVGMLPIHLGYYVKSEEVVKFLTLHC